MTSPQFVGTVHVHPPIDLQLVPRQVGDFTVQSTGPGNLQATSTHADAPKLFQGVFAQQLEMLSWDMIWERLVAVQLEPGMSRSTKLGDDGTQLVSMHIHETIDAGCGNPKYGIAASSQFGLLQTIRDRIISVHLAGGDPKRAKALMQDATLLLALEHFVKGIVNCPYAFAEFYSLVETIENRLGNRRNLESQLGLTKKDVDKITRLANQTELDQRHAPKDASAVVPVDEKDVRAAAEMARTIALQYSRTIP